MKRQINYSLVAIVSEGLFSRLSFGLISFSLPLYARHLGLSLGEVGVLAALNSAVAVVLKPLLGCAADRFGLKRTYLAAISLRSLVSLSLGFAGVPWELFAIRSVHGLSMSLHDPSANALIAEQGGKKSMASAFAWYQTARTVAGSASKALAGILLTVAAASYRYQLVFFLAFALSVLPMLVVGLYVKEPGDRASETDSRESFSAPTSDHAKSSAPIKQVRPKVFRFVGLGFLVASTAEMLSGLFPVLATEYAGLSKAQAGVIYAVSTLAIVFSGPFFGWLSDNVSRRLVLAVRAIFNTVSSILYVVAPTFAGVTTAKIVDDTGKAAFRPAWGSLMAEVSSFDRRNRARTMSWMSMGEDAGGVVSPILAGFLWGTWGITALMGVRLVLAIITEFYAFLVARGPSESGGRARQEAREGKSGVPILSTFAAKDEEA